MMKYVISEDRIIELIGTLIGQFYPNFSDEKSDGGTFSGGDDTFIEYYDPEDPNLIFARYYIWKEQLHLNPNLFVTLENYFGENVIYVLNWFNQEFDKDATSLHHI